MVKIRPFSLPDEGEARKAHQEFAGTHTSFLLDFDEEESWSTWLEKMKAYEAGDVPADRVRTSLFAADVDDVLVGRLSLRYEFNDFLRLYGGHLGYAIRPEFRRKGYASDLLRQGVERLRAQGIADILITVREDNLASRGVVEKHGATLEGPIVTPSGDTMLRYWINRKLP